MLVTDGLGIGGLVTGILGFNRYPFRKVCPQNIEVPMSSYPSAIPMVIPPKPTPISLDYARGNVFTMQVAAVNAPKALGVPQDIRALPISVQTGRGVYVMSKAETPRPYALPPSVPISPIPFPAPENRDAYGLLPLPTPPPKDDCECCDE